jgi:hypothetical protein
MAESVDMARAPVGPDCKRGKGKHPGHE